MATLFAKLKKYPLVAIFVGFIALFSLADTFSPKKEFSELENRSLAQAPSFDMAAFLGNEWTVEYGEYVRDQFLFRDTFITVHSALESAQGKVENGGVWYAEDGYQIAQNSTLTTQQEERIELNTRAIGELSERHPGQVSVMIVPSPANILSDKLPCSPPQIDENAILDGMFGYFEDAGANVIDLRGIFREHQEDYIYYRTDHHWTTEGGAWLAYEVFCGSMGIDPHKPDEALLRQADHFLGTNYAKTKSPFTQADTLSYYDFDNTMTVYRYQSDGTLVGEEMPLMDEDKLDTYDMYGAFLSGNNGYSVIEGNGEGSILIIKDSYGNCFAPYLIENYATIGVIDLRTWQTVDSIIEQEGYDEILVLYSFDNYTTDMNAYRMLTEMQG